MRAFLSFSHDCIVIASTTHDYTKLEDKGHVVEIVQVSNSTQTMFFSKTKSDGENFKNLHNSMRNKPILGFEEVPFVRAYVLLLRFTHVLVRGAIYFCIFPIF